MRGAGATRWPATPRRGGPPDRVELLKRVFGVDGWAWSGATPADCGKRMHLRTMVVGSPASMTIVTGLLRSTGPPGPRRGGHDQGTTRALGRGWRTQLRPRAGSGPVHPRERRIFAAAGVAKRAGEGRRWRRASAGERFMLPSVLDLASKRATTKPTPAHPPRSPGAGSMTSKPPRRQLHPVTPSTAPPIRGGLPVVWGPFGKSVQVSRPPPTGRMRLAEWILACATRRSRRLGGTAQPCRLSGSNRSSRRTCP